MNIFLEKRIMKKNQPFIIDYFQINKFNKPKKLLTANFFYSPINYPSKSHFKEVNQKPLHFLFP